MPAHAETRAGVDLVGVIRDTPTRLQFLLIYVKAKCVVGRDGLSIHWLEYEMGLGTEFTQQLQPPLCV